MDDIPSPEKCLYAAFVLSSEPLAKIESVDTQAAMNSLGAEAYISARDVPPGGQNMGISTFLVSEKYCFAEDLVECVGQPVGLMVRQALGLESSDRKRVHTFSDIQLN